MLWLYESRCQLSSFSEFDTESAVELSPLPTTLPPMAIYLACHFYWLFTAVLYSKTTPEAMASTRPFPL